MEELEEGKVEGAEGGEEREAEEELEEGNADEEEFDLKKKLKDAELKLERTRQQLESGLQMNRVDKMACSVLKEENMKMAEKLSAKENEIAELEQKLSDTKAVLIEILKQKDNELSNSNQKCQNLELLLANTK